MEPWTHRRIRRLRIALIIFPLLAACQKPVPLRAVRATATRVESTISTTTTGTVDAEQQAILAFGVIGRVDKVLPQAGDTARKGQLLAKLENQDLQAVHDNAIKELNRAKELFKDNLISRAGLDEAERAAAVAKVNLDKSEIRAPFDGVVTDVNLQVGELSQTTTASDKPPIRLVDEKPRIIKGDIDEIDLAKIQPGALARVRIPAARKDAFMATVDRVVSYVNTTKEQERTSRIELKLKDPDRTIPVGASAEIEVIVAAKDSVLAIPSRAVLGALGGASASTDGKPRSERYAFRFIDNRVRRAPIETGIGNYDRTEVLSGLSPNDVIVLPGDIELKDGMKAEIEIIPWP